jgi:DNA mismatch repair protein MutS
MRFPSILYLRPEDGDACNQHQPAIFTDLGLDQIVAAIIQDKAEYNLGEFFYSPLSNPEAVTYRHAAFQDIERPGMLLKLKTFAQRMRAMRSQQSHVEKRYHPIQQMFWFLDTVSQYCDAVTRLTADFETADIHSEAFERIQRYVKSYLEGDDFSNLSRETKMLTEKLAAIRSDILVRGLCVTVSPYAGEPDYGKKVELAFSNFPGAAGKIFNFDLPHSADVTAVVGKVLEKMAMLNEPTFDELDRYCDANPMFMDAGITAFDREIQFYIAFLSYIAPLRKAGLGFSYPLVSATDKTIYAKESFDLALATKLQRTHAVPVCNDVILKNAERILVVSGPNQGGKTTFARIFGQLHYFSGLGCLVASTEATLYIPDQIFTHFERAERMTSLRGKLQDDLIRIHEIFASATARSVIIINEIFASTTLEDATFLSHEIGKMIVNLDVLCVWVTFIEEISTFSEKAVSMVSTVFLEKPELRTFKIVRQAADGLAYAMSIARKYRLTSNAIRERIAR